MFQFDGATGGNQFLSTLEIRDETCELILDSEVSSQTKPAIICTV